MTGELGRLSLKSVYAGGGEGFESLKADLKRGNETMDALTSDS